MSHPERLLVLRFNNPAEHIQSITRWLSTVLSGKYHRGQEEHGGQLWTKPGALKNLEEEVLDLSVYYKTAKDQLRQMAREGKSAAEAYVFLYDEDH
jgi:hypothetical protein